MRQYFNVGMGADPELFAVSNKDGHPVSSEVWLGKGTKHKPMPMNNLPKGFNYQMDNVAGEFNIPPCYSKAEFSTSIGKALKFLKQRAKKKGCDLAVVAAMHFKPEQLMTEHAQLLGCEGDINAWLEDANPRPIPPLTLRTAAGHLHISWEDPTDDMRVALVKAVDLNVTVPSLLITPHTERRTLYGKSGACRIKTYGVECRSPDNFWIASRELREAVYNNTMYAIQKLNKLGQIYLDEINNWSEEIQECINTHNVDLAVELIGRFSVPTFPETPVHRAD